MSVKVLIPVYLKDFAGSNDSVELQANTIIECFTRLIENYPDLKHVLFTNTDVITVDSLKYFTVFLNGSVVNPDDIEKQLSDGDEIGFIYTLTGG